jgi:hypothetical protein
LPVTNTASAIKALLGGQETEEERQGIREALESGRITLASGDRAVAVGGSVEGAIITGDNNLVLSLDEASAEAVRQMFDNLLRASSSTAVNAKYLATLVGREPFTEALPQPLVQSGFDYVQINDASAAGRLSAVHVKLTPDPALAKGFGDDIQIFAHIEVYPTDQATRKRSSASMALMAARHQVGLEVMSPESFCVDGGAFWFCAGYRGLAYAAVTLSPGINAYLGVATGTLSALLGYTNKLAALATN